MIQEVFVDGEKTLLVDTEEDFDRAFGMGLPIQPTTMELARKMGAPDQEEGLDSAEAEDLKTL